jgi:ubiquinone/menaquinone biosynthesis C-methylase UbiE
MTEPMLEKARANATNGGFANVEFRRGEIEDLPVESGTADLVISNCVINLAPDKLRVFREIRRVLKPGGRFCVSDMVSKGHIPDQMREDLDQWACCIGGAMEREQYLDLAREVGFDPVEVKVEVDYDYRKTDEFSLASITVVGFKPDTENRT